MTPTTSSSDTSRPADTGDASSAPEARPSRRRWAGYVTILALLAAAAGGLLFDRYALDGAGGRHASAASGPPRPCGQPCAAAYHAIAEALPNDRDNELARAMLHTPHFDYQELSRALHVPTIAEIRSQWRRYCHARFPDQPRVEEACVRRIDSWGPVLLPEAVAAPAA